ncbi:MAG: T9SS type A sorting domain-containing protein, partial [Bacteroidales bacterium]|nr:T9SS type A sorting domain-containing protein [Bacteroidales bacterium]
WTNGATYPVKISETSIFHQIFKVDSADRKVQCMMFRANAFIPDYDTLNVDSLKYMDKNYPGQIYNIEVFSPAPEANVIYRLDTRFDSTTNLGKMKHRPVGLEYMGTDFKSILLSFPLYYIDSNDARKFIYYVMTEKFIHSVGIAPVGYLGPYSLQIYPNPVSDHCNVTFNLVKPGRIKLSLMSAHGQVLRTWIDGKFEQGAHSFLFDISSQSPGLYYVVLQGDAGRSVKIIIRH